MNYMEAIKTQPLSNEVVLWLKDHVLSRYKALLANREDKDSEHVTEFKRFCLEAREALLYDAQVESVEDAHKLRASMAYDLRMSAKMVEHWQEGITKTLHDPFKYVDRIFEEVFEAIEGDYLA